MTTETDLLRRAVDRIGLHSNEDYVLKRDIQRFLGMKEIVIWDEKHDQEKDCSWCGHPYSRHFDGYKGMAPVGCKYCDCREYTEA